MNGPESRLAPVHMGGCCRVCRIDRRRLKREETYQAACTLMMRLRRTTFEEHYKLVDIGLPSMTLQHAHTRDRDKDKTSEATDGYVYDERRLERLCPTKIWNDDPMGPSGPKPLKPHLSIRFTLEKIIGRLEDFVRIAEQSLISAHEEDHESSTIADGEGNQTDV